MRSVVAQVKIPDLLNNRYCNLILWIVVWVVILYGNCSAALGEPSHEIVDLPDAVDDKYDVTWTLHGRPSLGAKLVLDVEVPARGSGGYRLTINARQVRWASLGRPAVTLPTTQRIIWPTQASTVWTLKRRPETMALLCNHRLVLTAPAPTPPRGTVQITAVPRGLTLGEVRYQPVEPPHFGDDFMRPEALERFLFAAGGWMEDDIWQVASYQGQLYDGSSQASATPSTQSNPWQLSLFPNTHTTTNGFWFLYTGVGPSWVVARPTGVYPFSDRYWVEVAVKPEYESTVGVLAAYQDQQNYLLFRWCPETNPPVADISPRAELVSVVDGQETILATSDRGHVPGQWYRLRLAVGWQHVQVAIDGAPLLTAAHTGPVEGRIGLYADGAAHPRRPAVDAATAGMYVTRDADGHVRSEADDAMGGTSCVYFDDVRMGPWEDILDPRTAPYLRQATGRWEWSADLLTARQAGQLVTGPPTWQRTVSTVQLRLPEHGEAGMLLRWTPAGTGYAWVLSATGQRLCPLQGETELPPVETAAQGVPPGTWVTLRVETDGPYLACYLNGERMLETYDPAQARGQCGLLAGTAGVAFRQWTLHPGDDPLAGRLRVHADFVQDKWLSTWASPEADWYPALPPRVAVTPGGYSHATIGAAAPYPTNVPGLYWHKGGHYGDVRVTVPLTPNALAGQTLHWARNGVVTTGYRLQLTQEQGVGHAALWRGDACVAQGDFALPAQGRLLVERRGTYWLLTLLADDPEGDRESPVVLTQTEIVRYRDRDPLATDQVGWTVTTPRLPATALTVQSARLTDAFEQAPVDWVTQGGLWAVTARYSCSPQWNWFGGFGAGVPTAWHKAYVAGDQTVEAYLGVKMQYDNMPDEYARRFRDLNLTICADGRHLNSGYSVIRAGRQGETPVTMLLRKGEIVQTTRDPAHLLPAQERGHRHWFATRIEKRGGEIQVFLDNRLAMTYHDPDPLPGGYAAVWTHDNGMMVGRVNLSAQSLQYTQPPALRPPLMPPVLPAREVPTLTLNETPVPIATFEAGCEGWAERPGGGRISRERLHPGTAAETTVLTVVNSYPAGSCAVTMRQTPVDLAAMPLLAMRYCLPADARINLYLRQGERWYEILLNGTPCPDATIVRAGRLPVQADGQWHHLLADVGALLAAALPMSAEQAAPSLQVDEMVLADWGAPAALRAYGFGQTPGGCTFSVDDVVLLPRLSGPARVAWTSPAERPMTWHVGVDETPTGAPTTVLADTTCPVAPHPTPQFLHVQAGTPTAPEGACVHLPLVWAQSSATWQQAGTGDPAISPPE